MTDNDVHGHFLEVGASTDAGRSASETAANSDYLEGVGPEQDDGSIQTAAYIAGVSDRHLLALPLSAKARLVSDIVAGYSVVDALPPLVLQQLLRIYRHSPLDPAFLRYKQEARPGVAKAIAAIPGLRKLYGADGHINLREWQSLIEDPASLRDFIETISHTMLRHLGTDALPRVQGFVGKPSLAGFYDPDTNALNMNFHRNRLKDPKKFLEFIFHESSHAFETDLSEKFSAGKIQPDHRLYPQAEMFAANQRVYLPRELVGLKNYRRQPKEEHAYFEQRELHRAIMRYLPAAQISVRTGDETMSYPMATRYAAGKDETQAGGLRGSEAHYDSASYWTKQVQSQKDKMPKPADSINSCNKTWHARGRHVF